MSAASASSDSAPGLAGLLVVDKPKGWSSMDVVRKVRTAAPGRTKTGHAGTLDPLATGVVVCCLGRATRAVERIMGLTKVYEAGVDLSAFSGTDDREGPLAPVEVDAPPDRAVLEAALTGFVGLIEQRPPDHSAVKVGGRRAYEIARAGRRPPVVARTVRIDEIELLDYAFPELRLRVTCGRGTYIRSLARDLGRALETGGHLASLRRTAVGPYTLEQAVDPREITSITAGDLLPVPGEGGS